MGRGEIDLGIYYYSGNAHVKNRFVDDKKREFHMERLKNMKSAIDNNCPASFLQNSNNAKRQKSIQEREHKIDRENKLLLDKLARILNRKPFISTAPAHRRPTNPFEEQRLKEAKRVENENSLLVVRIHQMAQRSAYDRNRFLKERTENEMYIKRLSHYPAPAALSRPRTAPVSFLKEKKLAEEQQEQLKKRLMSAPPRKPRKSAESSNSRVGSAPHFGKEIEARY